MAVIVLVVVGFLFAVAFFGYLEYYTENNHHYHSEGKDGDSDYHYTSEGEDGDHDNG